MNILIFVIILLILVLVHEFGHFFTAKKFDIRVDEFGFGFPPKLFGIKKGETEYTFNLLPIGGFVKIFGEDPEAEQARYGAGSNEDRSRSFQYKAKWKQAIVLFAGIFANFLLAWVLFSFSFMSGLPTSLGSEPKGYEIKDAHLVILSVLPNSPAEIAGLKTGDKIVYIKVNDQSTTFISGETVRSVVALGKEIEIGYIRGKNLAYNMIKITPQNEGGKFSIGISMDQIGTVKLPFLRAFWEGLKLDISVTKDTAIGLYTLIRDGIMGKGSFSSITGPVGMVGIAGNAYEFGFVYLLSFMALISVNLAIINLIPFPALDGGRLLFLLIEKIKGSPLNPKFANTANMIGFAILIILMFTVTYHDVIKLF